MVDTFRISPDKLTYTFVLRNGLRWHDGQPVQAIDAVASLKRWAVKDAAGQKLIAKTASLEAADDKTLVLKLKEPYGLVLARCAKEYSYVPFIIPERQAVQPADKAFEGDEDRLRALHLLREGMGARLEDGLPPEQGLRAADRSARLLRRRAAAPPSTAWSGSSSPIRHGGRRPSEGRGRLHPAAAHRPAGAPPQGSERHREEDRSRSRCRSIPNHLAPPFDNPKARQALALMVDQRDYLQAIAGTRRTGRSAGPSSAAARWLETAAGRRALPEGGPGQRPSSCMQEAGYKGEKIVVMAPSDIAFINAASLTTAAHAPEDRRERRPPGHGLGHADLTPADEGAAEQEPGRLAHLPHDVERCRRWWIPWGHSNISTLCERAWFGWPCSPRASKALDDLGNTAPTLGGVQAAARRSTTRP